MSYWGGGLFEADYWAADYWAGGGQDEERRPSAPLRARGWRPKDDDEVLAAWRAAVEGANE